MKEVILEINDLDNPFEREKLESLPKNILVELLIRHLKRNIKAINYIEKTPITIYGNEYTQINSNHYVDDLENILRGEDNDK